MMLLQPFFKLYEFFPKCTIEEVQEVLRSPAMSNSLVELFNIAYTLRHLCGCPLVITSGYRNHAHNERVGGSKTSQHMSMQAFDCHLVGKPLTTLLSAIKRYDDDNPGVLGQVIKYGDIFIHIALSNSKHQNLDVMFKTY